MALKRNFNEDEKYGLTQEEIKMGEKYLRKHKTAGKIDDPKALKLFEMYLIGHSFYEIHQQFPQYPVEQIILTAALSKWATDRDNMMHTLRDRVQAKVVKSVIEQVDFLTTILSVNNAEHINKMRQYVMDPANNPKPDMRIESIKEYKEVVETLYKIVAGSTSGSKSKESALFNALQPDSNKSLKGSQQDDGDDEEAEIAALIAKQVDADE
jgi:hypothetical protein